MLFLWAMEIDGLTLPVQDMAEDNGLSVLGSPENGKMEFHLMKFRSTDGNWRMLYVKLVILTLCTGYPSEGNAGMAYNRSLAGIEGQAPTDPSNGSKLIDENSKV